MEDIARKSCWGVTLRAVVGVSAVLGLAYLFVAV